MFIFTFFRLDKSFSDATLDSAYRVDRLQALALACQKVYRNACFISACLTKFDFAKPQAYLDIEARFLNPLRENNQASF